MDVSNSEIHEFCTRFHLTLALFLAQAGELVAQGAREHLDKPLSARAVCLLCPRRAQSQRTHSDTTLAPPFALPAAGQPYSLSRGRWWAGERRKQTNGSVVFDKNRSADSGGAARTRRTSKEATKGGNKRRLRREERNQLSY